MINTASSTPTCSDTWTVYLNPDMVDTKSYIGVNMTVLKQEQVTRATEKIVIKSDVEEEVTDMIYEVVEVEECADKKKWCPCMEDECHKASIRDKCPKTCHTCETVEPLSVIVDTEPRSDAGT